MSDSSAGLQFEHASYQAAPEGVACGNCGRPIEAAYFQWQGRVTCEKCKGDLEQIAAHATGRPAFVRAALLGGATALGCGIAYAVFVAVSHIQLALLTIGIAYLVGKVVRNATRGVSGLRYQVLAVALTYFASSLGYAPAVWSALGHDDDASESSSSAAEVSAAAAGAAAPPREAATPKPAPSLVSLVTALVLLFGIVLASPVLAATDAPIGLLIVGFGLWEAWRQTRPLSMQIDGPYRVAVPATGPPPT